MGDSQNRCHCRCTGGRALAVTDLQLQAHSFTVHHLCSLSQGQITQEQSNTQLARLASMPPAFRLPPPASRARARTPSHCWSMATEPDKRLPATPQVSAALTPLNPVDALRSSPRRRAGSGTAAGSFKREVVQAALNRLLALKTTLASADADFFAIIAARLSASPDLPRMSIENRPG